MAVATLTPTARGSLSSLDLALVADAARACGIARVEIVKGSQVPPDANSGSTHMGLAGVGDIRIWTFPASKIEPLVVELRRRNCAAWLRDEAHGGFDPHIHFVVKDRAGLSPSAQRQVLAYDRGRDGLDRDGEDYHPRPAQTPFVVSREVRVFAPWTWVYDRSSLASPKLRRIWFGGGFEYVEAVRNREGVWLKNKAGNYLYAARTSYKEPRS